MKFNDNKKGAMRFLFYIIAVVTIISCIGGSKSGINSNDFAQVEMSDTLTIPKGAVPIFYWGHIYISCEVDSISGNFVFDTGADGLYLDSTYYASNPFRKIEPVVRASLLGVGSSGPQRVIVITDTVCFKFENYSNNITFIPVFLLKPILGDFADGIIGKKYFEGNVLEINYIHKYIRLDKDFSVIDTSGYMKINMKKENNRLFVPISIRINDTVTIQDYSLLDIGLGGSILITSHTADKYKLSDKIIEKIPYYTKYGGVSGSSYSYDFRAYLIEIGNFQIDSVTMSYSEDKSGSLSHSSHVGLLGNEILERFDVIIDFKNNDLYLKPNADYNKPFNFSKLGFGYVDRSTTMNAWIVTGLYRGSNAEIAGLEIDDKIISVNGIDIHKILFTERSGFWKKIDRVSLIVLRDGEEKRLEFDLEYVL